MNKNHGHYRTRIWNKKGDRATNKKEEHKMYHHAASKIFNYKYTGKKVPGIVCR